MFRSGTDSTPSTLTSIGAASRASKVRDVFSVREKAGCTSQSMPVISSPSAERTKKSTSTTYSPAGSRTVEPSPAPSS
jgi:hypothetical protein